jgi:hypothetical protein
MSSTLQPGVAAAPDALAGLRGYRLPDPVAWWPPAPGWWLLAVLLLAVAAALGWWWLRRRRCTAAAREAQRELAQLRRGWPHGHDGAAAVRSLSRLLRRYTLARFARAEVASLTGESWLAFLDAHGGGGRFRDGPGRQLAEAPYRPAPDTSAGHAGPADGQLVEQLADLVEDWIRRDREACR